MQLFEEIYKESYIRYHENPIPPNYLDPRVFYFPANGEDPILQRGIQGQIIKDIHSINTAESDYTQTRIDDYIIYGPILKERCAKTAPILVLVKISTINLSDILKEKILNMIKNINNKLATGTTHPIVYIPTIRNINLEKFYAAYHPFTEKWLKKPRFLGENLEQLKDTIKNKSKNKSSLKRGLKKITTV
jgi:hypothetical protein